MAYYGNDRGESFRIYYRGGIADDGMLEAEAFAESLLGAARFYKMLAHYSELGRMPRKYKTFEVYSRAAVQGRSVDQELILQAVDYSSLISAGIVGAVVKEVASAVIRWWTKPNDDKGEITRELIDLVREQHRDSNRITHRLLDMLERGKFDRIADSGRRHLHDFVNPLGESSCEAIVQFPDDREPIILTRPDAATIREDNIERTELLRFKISRIRRLNVETGNCSVIVDDDEREIHRVIFGEIEDPNLVKPNNDYTRIMNSQLRAIVFAEADVWNGYVVRLYIKGITEE